MKTKENNQHFDGTHERAKTTYQPYMPPQYRQPQQVYQPPIQQYAYAQPVVSSNEILMQKRIEQFTQQITNSLANLQNYIKSEIGGIKQRITLLETKVEDISRRKYYEADLDRSTMSYRHDPSLNYPPTLNDLPKPIFQSEFKNTPPKDVDLSIVENEVSDWTTILRLVQQQQINQAYTLAFSKNDEMLLLKLMGRSGICLDHLDSENIEKILKHI